jgi:hypothetical protein
MMQTPNAPDDTSWWDELIAGLSRKQVPPPPTPPPPPVDQSAWEKSVEQAHVKDDLTVHDVGLSVFGETQSLSDLPQLNEPIDAAREKVAHMIMNGAALRGSGRPSTHPPTEPSPDALRNPTVRAAYQSSMKAAREAYLSGTDPTQGAIYLNMPTTPDRSNLKYQGGLAQGVPIRTQSGPYHNSFPNRKVPSHTAWINTYAAEK